MPTNRDDNLPLTNRFKAGEPIEVGSIEVEPIEDEANKALAMSMYENLSTEIEEVIAATLTSIELTDEGEGGPLRRRLAFELAEMMTPGQANDFYRFARLVTQMQGAQG